MPSETTPNETPCPSAKPMAIDVTSEDDDTVGTRSHLNQSHVSQNDMSMQQTDKDKNDEATKTVEVETTQPETLVTQPQVQVPEMGGNDSSSLTAEPADTITFKHDFGSDYQSSFVHKVL